MQIALIAMTILGCDDAVTQCHYIATAPKQYASVELCDAASQKELSRFGNVNYPSVVAVCEKREAKVAEETAAIKPAPAPQPLAATALQPVAQAEEPGLIAHAMTLVSGAGSSAASMGGAVVRWPTHVVSKSYSWLIERVTP